MLLNGPGGSTAAWGYPALVKVRAPSQELSKMGNPLWRERDTLAAASDEPSGVYLPATLARALGASTVSKARPVLGLLYEQAEHEDVLTFREGRDTGTLWEQTARFPMRRAYSKPLMDLVGSLADVRVDPLNELAGTTFRTVAVRCGKARIDDLLDWVATSMDAGQSGDATGRGEADRGRSR